jgi:hypothetical protein
MSFPLCSCCASIALTRSGVLVASLDTKLLAPQQALAGVHAVGLEEGQHPCALLRRSCQPGQQRAKVGGELGHHAVRHAGRSSLGRAADGGPGATAADRSFLAQHLFTDHGVPQVTDLQTVCRPHLPEWSQWQAVQGRLSRP